MGNCSQITRKTVIMPVRKPTSILFEQRSQLQVEEMKSESLKDLNPEFTGQVCQSSSNVENHPQKLEDDREFRIEDALSCSSRILNQDNSPTTVGSRFQTVNVLKQKINLRIPPRKSTPKYSQFPGEGGCLSFTTKQSKNCMRIRVRPLNPRKQNIRPTHSKTQSTPQNLSHQVPINCNRPNYRSLKSQEVPCQGGKNLDQKNMIFIEDELSSFLEDCSDAGSIVGDLKMPKLRQLTHQRSSNIEEARHHSRSPNSSWKAGTLLGREGKQKQEVKEDGEAGARVGDSKNGGSLPPLPTRQLRLHRLTKK